MNQHARNNPDEPISHDWLKGGRRLSGDRLANLLVKHGIVDPCAVEDPDGYDHGRTLDAINCAASEIMEDHE